MKTLRNKTLVAAIVLAIVSGSAFAGAAKGKNVGATPKGADGDDSRAVAQLAIQLVQYGDKNKDPLALIAAAKMQVQLGMRTKAVEKEAAKGEAAAQPDTSKPALDASTQGVLARAKQYAGERKDLVALADDISASGSRGSGTGPFVGYTTVKAGATDNIPDTYEGGKIGRVVISGDGDTDLDLQVLDENGNVVCSSARSGDDEVCEFTPRWTGRFFIRVKNYGSVANRYMLMTN